MKVGRALAVLIALGGSLHAQSLCIDIPQQEWKCSGPNCDCSFDNRTGLSRSSFIERWFIAPSPYLLKTTKMPDRGCWDEQNEYIAGSRAGRSPVTTSPNGKYRAYVTVEALAWPESAGYGPCGNQAELYLSENSSPYEVAYREPGHKVLLWGEGPELGPAMTFHLGPWSADSSKLLVQVDYFTYQTDSGEDQHALIYDVKKKSAKDFDLRPVVNRKLGRWCGFEVAPIDFAGENQLLLEIIPIRHEVMEDVTPCVPKKSRWIFDYVHDNLTPAQ